MPSEDPDDSGIENLTDDQLLRWFTDDVVGSDGFKDLLEEASADPGGARPPGHSPYEGVDPELTEGMRALDELAAVWSRFGPDVGGFARARVDWVTEFSHLGRDARVKFIRGWNRQHPTEFAPLPEDDGGGWFRFSGKPTRKWLVAPALLLVVGASILAGGFFTSDGDKPQVVETVESEPQPGTGADSGLKTEPDPKTDPKAGTDPNTAPGTAPEPVVQTALSPGTIEGSAKALDSCAGTYDVFFRARLFNNGQMTFEQLLSAGGNPFQTAAGFWRPNVAVVTGFEAALFEAWYFYSGVLDLLTIYNVYGPSSPLVTAGSEVDLDDYAGVTSAADLGELMAGGPDSCVVELTDVVMSHAPFPQASG